MKIKKLTIKLYSINFIFITALLLFSQNLKAQGPNAPEASGFEPVSATDMVNLSTGDMVYVLPLLELNEFPISISYHAGIPLDMESSWVGLGWNINTGAISRGTSGIPDDWKNGDSIDFIYFSKSETFYSINVGVGFAEAAEVGVGLSWGSNKSLSGSVYASLGVASISISTDNSVTVGVGFGNPDSKYGGGISVTRQGNGDFSIGAGVGGRHGNATGNLGVNFSNQGTSFSISGGYSNRTGTGKDVSGNSASGGISVGNFSAGDFDISSKGFYIPINLGIFSFGFGKQKVTYTLKVGYPKNGSGILYSQDALNLENFSPDNNFYDYQKRYSYSDVYSQILPTDEEEFIGDMKTENEKINFSFASYDSFEVNANGISGTLQSKILQNATLFGLGYYGQDPDNTTGKMRIYYHNSYGNDGTGDSFLSTKVFGNNNPSQDNIYFYFNGQFTENATINSLILKTSFNGNENDLNDFSIGSRNTIINRKKAGNFVETYTNSQLDNNAGLVLTPESLYDNNTINKSKNRVSLGFDPNGIGAYKITSPDGKVYHFSLPVYHFERVERKLLENNVEKFVNEKRQYTPFATHWLLSAITGPDYVDTNNNNFPDDGDYGYWVRLDHGKWSDGFIWRTPYNGKMYNTNLENEIEDEDYGSYQFGRKQLYYLDKIVSSTHTAYFVKNIRYDATGAYDFANPDAEILEDKSNFTYKYTSDNNNNNVIEDKVNGGFIYPLSNFKYRREYQLKLDKIILVKNENALTSKNINPLLNLNTFNDLPGYQKDFNNQIPNYSNHNSTTGFLNTYGGNPQELHMEKNVYDENDFINFDSNKILKTIKFNYNYNLATEITNSTTFKGTPSSIKNSANPNKGKLALESIEFVSRDGFSYMPPYRFDYIGNDVGTNTHIPYPIESITQKIGDSYKQLIKAKDDWGFYKGYETAWSLNKITTPTGGEIEFEYEEDDYWREAFARNFFQQGFHFRATIYNGVKAIEFVKDLNYLNYDKIDLLNNFDINEKAYISFSLFKNHTGGIFDSAHHDWVSFEANTNILFLSEEKIIFKVPQDMNDPSYLGSCFETGTLFGGNFNHLDSWHSVNNFACNVVGGENNYNRKYNFLANKIPLDQTGGGTRVKNITLKDETGNRYITDYFYNQPEYSNIKGSTGYKSSGITSFSPGEGLKFVPYQSELPSPGVMYEWVTIRARESQTGTEKVLGSTRYRFHVLQPVDDIFNPNIKMYDDSGVETFGAYVTDHKLNNSEYYNTTNKIYAKTINLKVNTSLVGQFRSVEEFNIYNQQLKKTEKTYLSGEAAKNIPGRGTIKESFQTMKSIFKTNQDDNNPTLDKRLFSISTREDFTSVLNKVTTTINGQTYVEEFSDADPYTGAFRTSTNIMADGTKIRNIKYPAYEFYLGMGSKVDNINNKNMLTQEALNISSIQLKGETSWKTSNASITTWNSNWQYRNEDGTEPNISNEIPVWRKHKSFVWKDNIDIDGTYSSSISRFNSFFDWNTGLPVDNRWLKISEITRYNHYSSSLEVVDINGNYASSKMADNYTKTIVSGNTRYTEMYASGIEYPVLNGSYINNTEDEFTFVNTKLDSLAHTGKNGLYIDESSKAFRIQKNVGAAFNDISKPLKPGKYKISFWWYYSDVCTPELPCRSETFRTLSRPDLMVNGVLQSPISTVESGYNWRLSSFIVDLSNFQNTNLDIYLKSQSSAMSVVDDFRMHPIYSSIATYVYDPKTDELRFILDSNNMGTEFRYDASGRLKTTLKEVINQGSINQSSNIGGFKVVKEYNYNYKNQ